jgi:hypothetical protein
MSPLPRIAPAVAAVFLAFVVAGCGGASKVYDLASLKVCLTNSGAEVFPYSDATGTSLNMAVPELIAHEAPGSFAVLFDNRSTGDFYVAKNARATAAGHKFFAGITKGRRVFVDGDLVEELDRHLTVGVANTIDDCKKTSIVK